MRWVILAVSLPLLAPAAHASIEENEVAAHYTAQATEFLDHMLGPGRAKVLATVEGEISDVQTQTEVTTPILNLDDQGKKLMPGYAVNSEKERRVDFYQKDLETSNRRSGFKVKKIRISVVLDNSLPDVTVNAVRRVLPELLRLDEARGDDLAVLRASLVPSWKLALQSSDTIRTVTILIGMALLVILGGLMFYATAMNVVRALIGELSRRVPPPAPSPMPLGGPEAAGAGGALPELGPDGLPRLDSDAIDVEKEGDLPALGQRFDFLTSRDPAEVGQMISKEPPEDLALLFAFLANSHPDLASRIFSSLPIGRQGETSTALVKLNMADPEKLTNLENRLRNSIEFGVQGPDRLGRILSRLPPGERENLLGDLMSQDPVGAENVEKALFPFEKISEFKPEDLRRIIMAVPYQEWGVALRGAPEELVDRILAELPAGTRNLVSETAQAQQPRDKVMECRSKILSQVYSLAERGQISISREGASSDLI